MASSVTPGWITVPTPMVTSSSMKVVEGSRSVTPPARRASIRSWLIIVTPGRENPASNR
jgi:hypothetical protein